MIKLEELEAKKGRKLQIRTKIANLKQKLPPEHTAELKNKKRILFFP